MRRLFILVPLQLVLLNSGVFGQSLGDVARQNRQKEKAQVKPVKKVVTNDDIPEHPESSPGPSDRASKPDASSALPAGPAPKTAREWRMAIVTQADRVETLQAQIVKLNESIHFVTANAYVNGAEYNQYQVKRQQEVKNMQKQLEEEQTKFVELQLAARKEGMGASVYEP